MLVALSNSQMLLVVTNYFESKHFNKFRIAHVICPEFGMFRQHAINTAVTSSATGPGL